MVDLAEFDMVPEQHFSQNGIDAERYQAYLRPQDILP